ncbi:agamous-like MADS-box protein AGL8 homolog [Camellia sinensis]|uniref:agamous-like MADS-box protein AGL8 homolog n=1 Tax=Camellia sinensis TaxID=4442 RepID=UPI001036E4D2|nr:agamous-like MADS-box protein AGL8 homolog [Camellia sinensis]
MEKILEKYERYSYAERRLASPDSELQGSWSMEYPKLTARIEVLQRNIRHYVGEDLDPLSVRELQNLEQQIDTALKKIRSRKNQLMHESISELQKKEKALHEQNYLLANKLKESEKAMAEQAQWEQQTQNSSALTLPQPPLPPPPPTLHSLTIGGTYLQARGDDDDDAHARPSPNALMPPWMLRQMNH